ncbi:MAG TPA: hypothetical protein VJ768_10040 [Anaerolineales bacterium]|nr:hypothetical protein [Anaerolineales bacterium]
MTDYTIVDPTYHRYHIETETAPDIVPWPSRFKVDVKRVGLARLLLSELIHYRGDLDTVLSRPCTYGVFSGPLGGFTPREEHCVGCLRCTMQYPEFVQIRHNPARASMGDSYFTAAQVGAVAYEAESGRVPVKGAGYRGRFGGEGWDGMWTDMSEIVRPTRDGIHGREFISTAVDLGSKPSFLTFGPSGQLTGERPEAFLIPLPFIFDPPPRKSSSAPLFRILSEASRQIETLAVLPVRAILEYDLHGDHLVPLVGAADVERIETFQDPPRMVEMDGWDADLYRRLLTAFPDSAICLRDPFSGPGPWLEAFHAGVHIFHLTADYHGRGIDDRFVHDLIREAHQTFVGARSRDQITLIGSGGLIAAEHIPKAIIAGLDAAALDTALLVALQAEFDGECKDPENSIFRMPAGLDDGWGVKRLKNLSAAWRDQLLEILGAMGLREVRRLRGETGRAMYQVDLEREAFAGIEGYHA